MTSSFSISFTSSEFSYFSDDDYTYFLNIIDFNLKDEAPQVDFIQNEIKSIIVLQHFIFYNDVNCRECELTECGDRVCLDFSADEVYDQALKMLFPKIN